MQIRGTRLLNGRRPTFTPTRVEPLRAVTIRQIRAFFCFLGETKDNPRQRGECAQGRGVAAEEEEEEGAASAEQAFISHPLMGGGVAWRQRQKGESCVKGRRVDAQSLTEIRRDDSL